MADTYVVERTTHIAAAPETIYPHVADLRAWDDWSPWAEMDPNMERTYDGEPATVGSTFAWKGNRKVGQGAMKVTGLDEPSKVDIALDFLKPFKSSCDVEMLVEPDGEGSAVTWRMVGPQTFMTKVMGIFRSMDAMVGPDFERGLTRLKAKIEA